LKRRVIGLFNKGMWIRSKWIPVRIIIGILLILVGLYIGHTLWRIGAFYNTSSDGDLPPHCTTISFLPGPEDMELDAVTNSIYGISYDRWGADTLGNINGSLFRLSPQYLNSPITLSGDFPSHFFPHGMSLYRLDSILYMFVINHGSGGKERIERFRLFNNDTFLHQRTFTDSLIVSANDLVAIDTNRFYVANDSRSRNKFARSVDVFFQNATGYIVYYDGQKGYQVSENMSFPNGIAIDAFRNYLYVSETLGGNILQLRIGQEGYKLQPITKEYISQGLDNLSWDAQGNLWVTCQPNLMAVNRFMQNPTTLVPFEVYQIQTQGDLLVPNLILRHTGEQLAGASVALTYTNQLIIGSVCQSRIWVCRHPFHTSSN